MIVYGAMAGAIVASGVPAKSSNKVTMVFTTDSPLSVFDFFLFAYAQPVLDHAYFREAFGSDWTVAFRAVGFVSIALSLASLWIYWKRREPLSLSSVPALLVLFTGVSAAGIFLARFRQFGPELALSDRYLRLFDLGLVGALWINLLALVVWTDTWAPRRPWRLAATSMVAAMTAVVGGGFLLSSIGRWMYLDYTIDKKVHLQNAMYHYAADERFPIEDVHPSCGDGLCREAIEFLKEEQLSFFRSDSAEQSASESPSEQIDY
jgi:hypothetical protein